MKLFITKVGCVMNTADAVVPEHLAALELINMGAIRSLHLTFISSYCHRSHPLEKLLQLLGPKFINSRIGFP